MVAFTIIATMIIYQTTYHAFYPIIRAYRIKKFKKRIDITQFK